MSLRPKYIDFDATFAQFKHQISQIYLQTNERGTFIDPFQQVYDMCVARPKSYAEPLFDSISEYLVEHVEAVARTILEHDDIVSAYSSSWENYRISSGYLDKICSFLNQLLAKYAKTPLKRSVLPGKYRKQRIESLAFKIWKEKVFFYIKNQHSDRLCYQLMSMIKKERDGHVIAQDAVKTVSQSLVQMCEHDEQPLQYYIEEFEVQYLKNTVNYYKTESNQLISSVDISTYMKKATARLEEEVVRCHRYCDPTSHEKIIRECEKELILLHQKRIHSEFESMVDNRRVEDCNLAYSLLKRVPDGINAALEIFENYIAQAGRETVLRLLPSASKDTREFIEALMELHHKYISMCLSVFSNDPDFVAAVDKAFRRITNGVYNAKSGPPLPELMAKYSDILLKKSTKIQMSDTEIEEQLTKLVILFKYIDDKDVFQKFYSRMLAKRLIHGMSNSDDAEMTMISKLKAACGFEYTSKLQRMFTDITLSQDLNKRFETFLDCSRVNIGVDFNILVLTAGSWPLAGIANSDFQIPVQLEKSITTFSDFYLNHHNGRKLSWLHHLSKADVKLHNFDKKYELNVSLQQLSVILIFNDMMNITIANISNLTKMGISDVKRCLKSLVDLKLLDASDSSLESDDAIISLNTSFTNKRTKIKVTAAMQMESVQENESTRKAVDEDRRIYLQAVIVRIMKSRKQLGHTNLVQAVIDMSKSRFSPSIPMIKKSIEQLIEKGYIDRSKDQVDLYHYLA